MSLLWVIVDCMRADVLAEPRDEWPVMSALAARGARFPTCYCACPTTTPSVTSMFTGRTPTAHGVRSLRGSRLADEIPTVAERLSAAGHTTWGSATGPLLQSVGTFRGFDDVEYRDIPDRSVHSEWGSRCVARIEELAAAGRPYIACIHVWDAHMPRTYPPEFEHRRHGRTAYDRAIAGIDRWLGRLLAAAGPDVTVVLTGDHGENTFLGARSQWMQTNHKRVTRRLPMTDIAQWVLVRGARSDSKLLLRHAPRHLWGHGQTLFEPLVRVPLVVAGPDVAPGPRYTPVSHVDLAPTLLDLAGVGAGDGWPGRSLAGSVREAVEPEARPILMEIAGEPAMPPVHQRGIRDGRWKLITSFEDARWADALYDLETDPGERRNVARMRPDVADGLRAQLRAAAAGAAERVAIEGDEDEEIADRLRELGYL